MTLNRVKLKCDSRVSPRAKSLLRVWPYLGSLHSCSLGRLRILGRLCCRSSRALLTLFISIFPNRGKWHMPAHSYLELTDGGDSGSLPRQRCSQPRAYHELAATPSLQFWNLPGYTLGDSSFPGAGDPQRWK